MRFKEIHIDGFGCLHDATFDLKPGLNLFWGPNEAGKSTLQQAIWALMYGFYARDRKLARETELLERLRPWSGGTYSGTLVYRLDDGKSFRVVRDFDDDLQTSIWEADTGRDVTNQFERGRLGRVAFAPVHFGMSEEVFVNTCFVRQADLHHLADAAQEITETIVNLSGTGSQDRSVKRALELLEGAFKAQVGTARARTKPLPKALENLDSLTREKQRILAQREAMGADYERRNQCLAKRAEYTRKESGLRFLEASALDGQLEQRIGRIEALLARNDQLDQQLAELRDVEELPVGQRDVVLRLFQDWSNCRERVTSLSREIAASASTVIELKAQLKSVVEQQRSLEIAREFPLEKEPEIRILEQDWRNGAQRVQELEAALNEASAKVEELAEVRDAADQYAAAIEGGVLALHDLRLKWEAADEELSTAMREAELAEQAWEEQSLAVEAYEQLRVRFETFSFDALTVLKNQKAAVSRQIEETTAGISTSALAGLIGLGGLVTLGGILAIVTGSARIMPILVIGGTASLLGGLVIAASGFILLRRRTARTAQAQVASKKLSRELEALGYQTVDGLEAAYQAYLEAQAPYQRLVLARKSLAGKRLDWEEIRKEGRSLLGLGPDAALSVTEMIAAEQEVGARLKKLEELQRREGEHERIRADFNRIKADFASIGDELRGELRRCGLASSDPSRDVARFYELCADRHHLERLDSERRTLDAQMDLYQTKEKEVHSANIALEVSEKDLRRALRHAGIDEVDLEQGFRQFESRWEEAELVRRLRADRESLQREAQALLGTESIESLKRQQAKHSTDSQALLAAHPDLRELVATDPPEVLRLQLDDIRREIADISADLAATEQRLSLAGLGLRSLVEVEEELQTAEETIAALTFHGQALELAIEHLAAAADEHHRNFLPRLNQSVGQNLSQITAGRYSSVQIDHSDLQIRLKVPERSSPVSPDMLSRGAREQIYLLLRLGLTEIMSRGRERLPLMLDDPLVNYDHDRLMRSLDFLARLAEQSQVLLFTKDEETVRWFRSHHADDELHTLCNL